MGKVLSVNVARPRLIERGGELVRTGIWKEPVEGRCAVRGVNVDGDDQGDRTRHGGPDKAVYAYASEDIAWWSGELGRVLGPGIFGENLTLGGIDVTGARVGERWQVGTATLEVVGPRMPCWKLETKMELPGFIETFTAAGRPGAYLRIVAEGDVAAGDDVVVLSRTDGETMGERMRKKAARD